MAKIKDIVKTDNIIKIFSSETLSTALSKLSTSHDSCFVFSDDDKYLGVINPYYSLIRASYPSNAKVEHCLFHAPHVHVNTPINKLAQLFIDSKIHYLPVFDEKEKFIGIISARRLLSTFKDSPTFKIPIDEFLKTKKNPTYTIYEDGLVSQALSIFKEKKISKLIVVNKDFKLKGILSYYDLIAFLISPRNSAHRGDRVGNKINFYHYRVTNFAKTYVLTLSKNHLVRDALMLILEKKIGSVVIIDDKRHPIGIITTKDLLRFFINLKAQQKIEIISKNLSQKSRQILGGFFNRFNFFLRKDPEVKKARLFVKEEKKGLFEAVLSLFPKRGNPQVIKKEGKNLPKVLEPFSKILKRIKKR